MKNILVIMDQAPYANASPREALDAIMVFGVFGQAVTLLFRGEGLWQLLPEQAAGTGVKNHLDALKALPMYDITHLVVESDALYRRGLHALPEVLKPDLDLEIADQDRISQLIRNADLVIRP